MEWATNFWTFTGERHAYDVVFVVANERPLEVFILDVSTRVGGLPTPFIIIAKPDGDLEHVNQCHTEDYLSITLFGNPFHTMLTPAWPTSYAVTVPLKNWVRGFRP